MTPDERAIAIAARIADGSAIDWQDAISVSPDSAAISTLAELKTIAALANMHRAPDGWTDDGAPAAGSRWGTLVLVDKIGEGRFGDVYRAWESRLQRQVALKLLRASPRASTSSSHAIEEARLLARVRHPNVLTVHGAEILDGQIGIWTEFIEGRTLEGIVTERGLLPADEVVAIGIDLCRALAAVHAAGLLHRDVKAQNVMRETGGRIVLMDFGTGQDLDVIPARAGDFSGTPLYLAPEIFAGGAASVASDLYALAVLLFYALTGQYPASGRTLDEVRRRHEAGEREQLRQLRPDVPEALTEAIERGLAADPSVRYRAAAEFEAALNAATMTAEAPSVDTPLSSVHPQRGWIRLAWFAGAAAAVLTVVVGWVLAKGARDARVGSSGASVPTVDARQVVQAPALPASSPPSAEARPPSEPPSAGGITHDPAAAVAGVQGPSHRRLSPPRALVNWSVQPSRDGRYWPYVDIEGGANRDMSIWEPATGARHVVRKSAERTSVAGDSAMSADGRQIAFVWTQQDGDALLVANADGSELHRILPREAADLAIPIEWSRDGHQVLCWLQHTGGRTDLALVPASSGAPKILQTFAFRRPGKASLSPDARYVVYDNWLDDGPGPRDVFIIGTEGSSPRALVSGRDDDFSPLWTPDGTQVFFLRNRSGSTEGWLVDVADGIAQGAPRRVAPDLAEVSLTAFTNDGALYYTRTANSVEVFTMSIDLTGVNLPGAPVSVQRSATGDRLGPSWSPDGKSLSYVTNSRGPGVSIQDMATGRARALKLRPALLNIRIATRWSPDGSTILVRGADMQSRWGYFAIDVRSGAVRPALLFDAPDNPSEYGNFQWSRTDANSMLFRHLPHGIVSRNLTTGSEQVVFDMKAQGLTNIAAFAPSPDGLSLGLSGARGQGPGVFVQTGSDPVRQLVQRGADETATQFQFQGWTPDSRRILFTKFRNSSNAIQSPQELWIVDAAGGAPRDTGVRISGYTQYLVALSPDGRRLAYTLGEQLGELWVMENFLPKPGAGKRP